MSAVTAKADIGLDRAEVRKWPKSDIGPARTAAHDAAMMDN